MGTRALDFIPEGAVALTVSQTLGQQLGFHYYQCYCHDGHHYPIPGGAASFQKPTGPHCIAHSPFSSLLQYLRFISSDIWKTVETV